MQQIEIRVKGYIHERWSGWFGGLTISHPTPDQTILTGTILDQAALYGVISRLRDLGVKLTFLSSEEIEENIKEGQV